LGDAIGELRREVLECIRRGEVEHAEELYSVMEVAYVGLSTFDYPDALTNNLRRRIDVARSLVERTHGDVVTALRQNELEKRLEK
jgi:translin